MNGWGLRSTTMLRCVVFQNMNVQKAIIPGADKSLARPWRKQVRKRVRDASDFNNTETRAVIKSPPPLQGKAPKEIHAILTETLACFLLGRAKDLSAPLYKRSRQLIVQLRAGLEIKREQMKLNDTQLTTTPAFTQGCWTWDTTLRD